MLLKFWMECVIAVPISFLGYFPIRLCYWLAQSSWTVKNIYHLHMKTSTNSCRWEMHMCAGRAKGRAPRRVFWRQAEDVQLFIALNLLQQDGEVFMTEKNNQ